MAGRDLDRNVHQRIRWSTSWSMSLAHGTRVVGVGAYDRMEKALVHTVIFQKLARSPGNCLSSELQGIFKLWPGTTKGLLSVQTMFQKYKVQNTKCFSNVRFKTWRSKQKTCWKCDVPNIKCFRNVTFKIWNVSETWYLKKLNVTEMWRSKHEIFQKCNVLKNEMLQKCYLLKMKRYRHVLLKM